ncbi:DUF4394 domain-containing protein [Tenggerimyces flavus]|uniref:DUF4394 domain-containing protein n=1 Tax=Tenggerimyces flavus TaxID=1708749 RepID=A0ABV7YBG7_9ACTN|nr:DUF4394 domain-containing protein [Tenggerimyces flavus]MBM7789741.1 hypothetical protein [Tenggerimyces flavus]
MKRLLAVMTTVALATTAGVLTMPSASASSGGGGQIYLLEKGGTLSTRDANLPLLAKHRVKIRGLDGDRLVGIDTRPATGELYGLGKRGQLYVVDARSGRASAVGSPAAGAVGDKVGFDFNPTVDRIRVVTSAGRNVRLHPDTGAVAGVDGDLAYSTGGSAPRLAASAYTNSVAGATTTGLYGLDSARDTLVTQGTLPGRTPVVSPNTGQLFKVGRLGLDITSVNGFDLRPGASSAIAAVERDSHGLFGSSKLVRVNLKTGHATPLLALGLGDVVGLAYSGGSAH